MAKKRRKFTVWDDMLHSSWYRKLHKDEAIGYILIVVGFIFLFFFFNPGGDIFSLWPIVFIVIGYWILLARGGPQEK